MGNWQWLVRSQLRRLRESDATQKMRFFFYRHVHSPRRIALILCALLFIIYCLFSSRSSESETVAFSCLDEKLRSYNGELSSFSSGKDGDAVFFIGNGYLGVGDDGEMRIPSGKTLGVLTGFHPLVSIKLIDVYDVKEALITDFLTGKVRKIECASVDGECICSTTTTYTHRTKKNIIIQDIQISNPTKSSIKVSITRPNSPLWKSSNDKNDHDNALLIREDIGNGGRSIGSVICSSTPSQFSVSSKREESLRFTCAIDIREKNGEGYKKESIDGVVNAFNSAKAARLTIDKEHDDGWRKLNEVSFHLSHSFASNVLNGIVINSTRYIILSNVRAPLIEEGISPQERTIIEAKGSRRDLCYTGHSTLLYPSRLWEKNRKADEIVSLVDTWLLTLEKRGCASLVEMGANGIVQAYVLSLSAATFHDGHIELGMDPADMHREISVHGIEMNDISRSKISFSVGLNTDNRPFLMVSSSSELYACDGACRSDPIKISSTGTKISVMLTKPLTSILYIAPNRKHLTQLRNAIHISEIDVAPAHEDEVISRHKNGEGGLPTSLWIFLGIILVAFHAFLIKLLYSEWRKGDSTPFNPYLRQRYFREH